MTACNSSCKCLGLLNLSWVYFQLIHLQNQIFLYKKDAGASIFNINCTQTKYHWEILHFIILFIFCSEVRFRCLILQRCYFIYMFMYTVYLISLGVWNWSYRICHQLPLLIIITPVFYPWMTALFNKTTHSVFSFLFLCCVTNGNKLNTITFIRKSWWRCSQYGYASIENSFSKIIWWRHCTLNVVADRSQ